MKEETILPVCETLRKQALDMELLNQAKSYALDYMTTADASVVFPDDDAIQGLEAFNEPLPEEPDNPYTILEQLHQKGSPATVKQIGGRYFGFVNGGIVPAALASKWLADVWDQNAAMYISSPIVSKLEEVCESWLISLLGLPEVTSVGFVSGSSIATLCGLTAGRNQLLKNLGYDVAKQGLFGAPEIKVVLSEGAHSTVYKALSILGLGSERVIKVPMDVQGRICPERVPKLDNKTLLILQAGNVNTGAFDDFETLCKSASEAGAWVHIDGAFGLWAAASKELKYLTKGYELADSWSADAHKTLNAPYDNGLIFCRHREALISAMSMSGAYIVVSEQRDGMIYTMEMSRRARAVELWATLKSLGRNGVGALVENLNEKAVYFARQLSERGYNILNEVCFNQVLVSHESPELTPEVLRKVQNSGVLWCGGSSWNGKPVIRISVCSYQTTFKDIDRCVEVFSRIREEL